MGDESAVGPVMMGDPAGIPFPLKPCCEEAVATATDGLDAMAKGLFAKAEAALDLAVVTADVRENADSAMALVKAAETYLILAEMVS